MVSRKDLANAIRVLGMDAVEQAKSGHPGAPMGMADMAEVLWNDFMKHNPADPTWPDRDRFVLSNGHASMLIYALLHLSGYAVSMDDIRRFRQLGSITPGHPEYGVTPGVEITTGPLGQGIAAAVGMAMAERMLAEEFNRQGFTIVDHHTYVFLGDGCMMEGLSHEACSLAGTLGLGKLIALYDDNGISIDGRVDDWFGDDTPARFRAYGWHVVTDVDGHDACAVRDALHEAKSISHKPSLLCCKTIIGKGAPNMADSSKVHGAPLGAEEIVRAREAMGWKHDPFVIPDEIYTGWDARPKGGAAQQAWKECFQAYAKVYPDLASEYTRRMAGTLPEGWSALCHSALECTVDEAKNLATRKAGLASLEAIAPALPELVGGSADLTGSVGTKWSGSTLITPKTWSGNYISYGVREFAMGAIMNGLVLHGGYIPYAGTFLVFSDYAKNAFRLSALMGVGTVWVLTHDSIGVGEDGPTHQPVEQLAGLRLIPGAHVWRPCDTVETQVAWHSAVEYRQGPTALSLTRQGLPFMSRDAAMLKNIARGGYVLRNCEGTPELILMASGSEVGAAHAAWEGLTAQGWQVRLVSMPCTNIFDQQSAEYRQSVLPREVEVRVAVEAASADFWWKYVGLKGRVVGMTSFGESAPGTVLFEHFGFTADNIMAVAKEIL